MTISATDVRFDDQIMWLELTDGRSIGVPLAWFPKLLNASKANRAKFEISPMGLHWDALDEDISIAGLLTGHRDQTVKSKPVGLAASAAELIASRGIHKSIYVGRDSKTGQFVAVKEAARRPNTTTVARVSKNTAGRDSTLAPKVLSGAKKPKTVKSLTASTLTQAPDRKRKRK